MPNLQVLWSLLYMKSDHVSMVIHRPPCEEGVGAGDRTNKSFSRKQGPNNWCCNTRLFIYRPLSIQVAGFQLKNIANRFIFGHLFEQVQDPSTGGMI